MNGFGTNWFASDAAMVGKLIAKDWQVYQKQLAGYVAGMLFALGLIGMGTPLLAAAGALAVLEAAGFPVIESVDAHCQDKH